MIDILAGRLFYISIFLLSFLHPGLSGYAAEITVTLTPRKVEKHEGGSSQIDKLNQLLQQTLGDEISSSLSEAKKSGKPRDLYVAGKNALVAEKKFKVSSSDKNFLKKAIEFAL